MPTDDPAGWRVLVVEDETLIAVLIEETLRDLGCVVVGPVSTLAAALRLASDDALDASILDVTIRGGKVYPVAERLLARDIPFVLASGYGEWALPESSSRPAPLDQAVHAGRSREASEAALRTEPLAEETPITAGFDQPNRRRPLRRCRYYGAAARGDV